MSEAVIYGPDPIQLEGRVGNRYWVHHDFKFTGDSETDARLSGYPVAVFQPHDRAAPETPVVLGVQGIAAPYQWNGFLVPTLLDMGIACVLFDSPLGGERSLARSHQGNVVAEALAFQKRGVALRPPLVLAMMEAVARDFGTVIRLLQERHGLGNERRALFGVSWGTLLAGYAFLRYGVGTRLLGTLGHVDFPRFVRSYTPRLTPLLVSLPGRLVGKVAQMALGPFVGAGLAYLGLLRAISKDKELTRQVNPLTYRDRVGQDRRVRFLVGQEDLLVRPADAVACSQCFPNGECYVVPGLAHGFHLRGPSFVEHVRYFLGTQLGDWAR